MGRMILVLGGARSGKSAYAQRLAQELGGERVLFVATAEAGDAEMARRIDTHRRERPAAWRTLEAPRHTGQVMRGHLHDADVVLIDCLTLLVSNTILPLGMPPPATAAETLVRQELEALIQVCRESPATFVVVSNEVGLGLVPETALGRLYRDLQGLANQTLAAQARSVYLLVAGLAVDIKALAGGHNAEPG